MTETFENFVDAFHKHFTKDANARLHSGLLDGLGKLPDPSSEASLAQAEEARVLLSRLDAIDAAAGGFDDQLDAQLASLMLRAELHDHTYIFNGQTKRAQLPKAGDEIGDGIFLLFINDPRPDAERLDDIVARLDQVPTYLKAMLARLRTPIARWVAMDIETTEGLPSLFATVENWAGEVGYPRLPSLQAARASAEAALARYVTELKALPTSTQLHVGDEVARQIVALRGIDKSF